MRPTLNRDASNFFLTQLPYDRSEREGHNYFYEIAEKNVMRNTFWPPVNHSNEAKVMKYKLIGLFRKVFNPLYGAHGEMMKIIRNGMETFVKQRRIAHFVLAISWKTPHFDSFIIRTERWYYVPLQSSFSQMPTISRDSNIQIQKFIRQIANKSKEKWSTHLY